MTDQAPTPAGKRRFYGLLAVALVAAQATPASAEVESPSVPPPLVFGGDIQSRPKLSGDWGSSRTNWPRWRYCRFRHDLRYRISHRRHSECRHHAGQHHPRHSRRRLDDKAQLWPGGLFSCASKDGGDSVLGVPAPCRPSTRIITPNSPGNQQECVRFDRALLHAVPQSERCGIWRAAERVPATKTRLPATRAAMRRFSICRS
jgi:hypothetical protein